MDDSQFPMMFLSVCVCVKDCVFLDFLNDEDELSFSFLVIWSFCV